MAHVFTGTGDDGSTFCPALKSRVPKDHALIELYGSLDEVNSFIGLARSLLSPELKEVNEDLKYMQHLIFRIGYTISGTPSISQDDLTRLEEIADRYYGAAPLKHFILPAGPAPAAALHVARSVARRFERVMVKAMREYSLDPLALRVANRLNSALFAMAVYVAKVMGYPEEPA